MAARETQTQSQIKSDRPAAQIKSNQAIFFGAQIKSGRFFSELKSNQIRPIFFGAQIKSNQIRPIFFGAPIKFTQIKSNHDLICAHPWTCFFKSGITKIRSCDQECSCMPVRS